MLTYIILASIAGAALSVKHGDEKFANIPVQTSIGAIVFIATNSLIVTCHDQNTDHWW